MHVYVYSFITERSLFVFHRSDHISVLHYMYKLYKVHSFSENRNRVLPMPSVTFGLVAERQNEMVLPLKVAVQ